MLQQVSKSQLKPYLLEYLRKVAKTKEPIIVTHDGTPVAQIIPYSKDADDVLGELRGSVITFDQPLQPVKVQWETLKK